MSGLQPVSAKGHFSIYWTLRGPEKRDDSFYVLWIHVGLHVKIYEDVVRSKAKSNHYEFYIVAMLKLFPMTTGTNSVVSYISNFTATDWFWP